MRTLTRLLGVNTAAEGAAGLLGEVTGRECARSHERLARTIRRRIEPQMRAHKRTRGMCEFTTCEVGGALREGGLGHLVSGGGAGVAARPRATRVGAMQQSLSGLLLVGRLATVNSGFTARVPGLVEEERSSLNSDATKRLVRGGRLAQPSSRRESPRWTIARDEQVEQTRTPRSVFWRP